MARKSGFVRRGGVMRRETHWVGEPFSTTTIASTNGVAIISSLTAVGLALRPFTVIRSRGYIHVESDQDAVTERYGAAVGYCVVSEQATAIGVTAVPTPDTDQDSDLWLMLEQLFGRLHVTTDISRFESGIGRQYDSKAMRKVEDGQDLILVAECPTTSGNIMIMGRQLLKLH